MVWVSPNPSVPDTLYALDSLFTSQALVKRPIVPLGTPGVIWLVVAEIFPREHRGQMENSVALECLSSRTSIYLQPGRSQTEVVGFAPGGPSTTSVGCSSKGYVKNEPRDTPSQRTPRNLQPSGIEVSPIVRCLD